MPILSRQRESNSVRTSVRSLRLETLETRTLMTADSLACINAEHRDEPEVSAGADSLSGIEIRPAARFIGEQGNPEQDAGEENFRDLLVDIGESSLGRDFSLSDDSAEYPQYGLPGESGGLQAEGEAPPADTAKESTDSSRISGRLVGEIFGPERNPGGTSPVIPIAPPGTNEAVQVIPDVSLDGSGGGAGNSALADGMNLSAPAEIGGATQGRAVGDKEWADFRLGGLSPSIESNFRFQSAYGPLDGLRDSPGLEREPIHAVFGGSDRIRESVWENMDADFSTAGSFQELEEIVASLSESQLASISDARAWSRFDPSSGAGILFRARDDLSRSRLPQLGDASRILPQVDGMMALELPRDLLINEYGQSQAEGAGSVAAWTARIGLSRPQETDLAVEEECLPDSANAQTGVGQTRNGETRSESDPSPNRFQSLLTVATAVFGAISIFVGIRKQQRYDEHAQASFARLT